MGDSGDPAIIDELFKKVRTDEILDDLKQIGVNVNPEAFRNPKPEESLGLYSLAIQVVFGKTLHDIRPEELYGKLSNRPTELTGFNFTSESVDFLKNGIGNLRLWRYCQRLHSVLGLREIQRFELFNPTSESFTSLISSFVIYLRFREALYSLFEVTISNLDLLADQDSRLSEDIKGLIEENDKFKNLSLDNSVEHESLLRDKHDLETRLLGANEEFSKYKTKSKELDLEVGRVKSLLNDTMLSKTRAQYTFDDLSEHFTTNLDTANKLYKQLKSEDSNQNEKLESLMDKVEDLKSKYSKLLESCSIFDRLKRNLSDHYKDVILPHIESLELSRKASVKIESLNGRISELTATRDSLLKDLDLQNKIHEEQLRKLNEECQIRVEQAKKFALETSKNAELVKKKVEETRGLIDQVNSKILETRSNSQDFFSKLDSSFDSLLESSCVYNEKLDMINCKLTEAST